MCGAAVCCPQVGAEVLISATGADPTLVPLAASYMRIRALAQPAVLVTMASQGGLLAQRVSALGCCLGYWE
jgi:Na+-driven multidrug efflux pump